MSTHVAAANRSSYRYIVEGNIYNTSRQARQPKILKVMKKARSSNNNLDLFVRIDNQDFRWRIQRQPQWCTADGWKGLTLHVELAREPRRALITEFPFKIVNHRNDPAQQRPKVTEKDVVTAISAALTAGWNPESRGKPFRFNYRGQ